MQKENLKKVFDLFKVEGNVIDIVPFGTGLINKTFLVKTDVKDYMLQAINSYAFHNVDDLMRNIYIVTTHLRRKDVFTLHVRKTLGHKIYVKDKDTYYRLYTFISDTVAYESLEDPSLIFKTGEAFGEFHSLLADLDSILIAETIPNFHNTPSRYKDLMKAVNDDPCNRLETCLEEFNYIVSNKRKLSLIMDGLNNGTIPQRIVHNDPKINNILFDKQTGEVKCVIDLDTVMPGSCLFDYGDGLRSLFTGENESNPDTSVMKVNFDTFKLFTEGYLSKMKNDLTKLEIELMPMSIFTIAMELGIRFLEDYIKGDVYFKTSFEGENLVRAKGQIALAKDVMKNMPELKKIINSYLN